MTTENDINRIFRGLRAAHAAAKAHKPKALQRKPKSPLSANTRLYLKENLVQILEMAVSPNALQNTVLGSTLTMDERVYLDDLVARVRIFLLGCRTHAGINLPGAIPGYTTPSKTSSKIQKGSWNGTSEYDSD